MHRSDGGTPVSPDSWRREVRHYRTARSRWTRVTAERHCRAMVDHACFYTYFLNPQRAGIHLRSDPNAEPTRSDRNR